MQAVLISIRPKWCSLIARGEKTLEVRKTKPRIDNPFKCYIYCTKPNTKDPWEYLEIHRRGDGRVYKANGKVIGEFTCDMIEPLNYPEHGLVNILDETRSGLTAKEMIAYSSGKPLYGWHISNFRLYARPKALKEFTQYINCEGERQPVVFAPQSWMYVEGLR